MINQALDLATQVYTVCGARELTEQARMQKLQTLVEQNHASPNWANADGRTPLLLACNSRQLEVARYLLRHGADVNHTDAQGVTALHCASKHGDLQIAKLLLENKADPNLVCLTGVSAVLMATCHGNNDVVWALVRHGADINVQDDNRCTPLDWARHRHDQQLVHLFEAMIKRGKVVHRMCNDTKLAEGTEAMDRLFKDVPADLNWMDANGDTAIIRAAHRGHAVYVKYLIGKGAEINHVNRYGYTAALCAAVNNHGAVVTVLIDNNADWTRKVRGKSGAMLADRRGHPEIARMIRAATPPVPTLAHDEREAHAAELYGMCKAPTGNRCLVDQLLKQGVLADWANEQGMGDNPLIAAISNDRLDLVEVLLLHGADANQPTSFGSTPLHEASEKGHLGIAFLLLEHGAYMMVKDCVGKSPFDRARGNVKTMFLEMQKRAATLFDACATCDIDDDRVLALLEDGSSNSNWTDATGCSCLTYLSWYGHAASVNTILDHYADVDQRNIEGLNALACASINGHVDTVKLLLRYGADVNAVTNAGDTALMCATCYSGPAFPEIVATLLQYGADPNIANEDGRTALIRVCKHNEQPASFVEIVSALIRSGAELDHADDTGSTALMWACLENNFVSVKALVQAGADVCAVNKDGSTAVICACEGNCDVVLVKYLLDHGVPPAHKDIDGFTASDYAQHAGNNAVFELCRAYTAGARAPPNGTSPPPHPPIHSGVDGLPTQRSTSGSALPFQPPTVFDTAFGKDSVSSVDSLTLPASRGSGERARTWSNTSDRHMKKHVQFHEYNPSGRTPSGRTARSTARSTPPNVDGRATSGAGTPSGPANDSAAGEFRIAIPQVDPPSLLGNAGDGSLPEIAVNDRGVGWSASTV